MLTKEPSELLDKQRLEFSINTRETIIKDLMQEGTPKTDEDRTFLVKLLDGMDRTILTKTKVINDSKQIENEKNINRIIASALNRVNSNSRTDGIINPTTLDSSITIDDIVEGETTMGKELIEYNSFFEEDI